MKHSPFYLPRKFNRDILDFGMNYPLTADLLETNGRSVERKEEPSVLFALFRYVGIFSGLDSGSKNKH